MPRTSNKSEREKESKSKQRKYNPINILDMETIGTKGNYRLINDGCATVPYLITIEKKKYIQVAVLSG